MATDSDLDGSGGGTNAASRPSRAPFIDLERPDEEEEEDSFHSTEPGEEDEVEETRDADTAGSTPTGEDAESLRQLELRKALERLDDMCIVLGVDYKKKLLEMGVTSMDDLDLDVKRVYDEMDLLQLTIDANYPKLKAIGKELLKEWEVCDTPFRKMIEFAHVVSVSDSRTSKDVVDANFLSTTYLKRAQNHLKQLQKERIKAEKSEYDKQKNKLKEMILENHLSWSDVGFDPKKKAVIERYPQETLEIQKKIEKAKELSVGRKELVFRVEVVRQMIQQKKLPFCIIRGLLELAKNHVLKITDGEGLPVLMYDGEDINTVLEKFGRQIDELEDEQKKEEEKTLRMQRVRTRKGRTPPPEPSSS